MVAISIDKLRALAEITLSIEPNDFEPDFDNLEDLIWVRDQLARGNDWAWFTAKVTATYAGVSGVDYLGGCSYASEASFREPGGYFDDMVTEALRDLAGKLEKIMERISEIDKVRS